MGQHRHDEGTASETGERLTVATDKPADLVTIGAASETEISETDVIGKTDVELFPGEIGQRGYDNDMEVLSGKAILNKEEFFYDKMLPQKSIDEVSEDVEKWAKQRKDEIEILQANEQFRKEFLMNLAHELQPFHDHVLVTLQPAPDRAFREATWT